VLTELKTLSNFCQCIAPRPLFLLT
jgi:hypothetical protein